jgi:general secretion pathway protein D
MKLSIARAQFAAAAAVLIVSACAQNPAFRDGMLNLAEGRIEQGLAQLEQASREAPGNPEYRSTLFRQRELAVNQFLAQAEGARTGNDLNQAEAMYRRALGIEPANARARQGLEEIALDRRHKALTDEAAALLAKNDRAGAAQKLRLVLGENPARREARAMLRRIEEANLSDRLATGALKADLKRPITLEFRDAALRGIFDAIARSSGVNYVFDKDVRADLKMTIQLRNKSIDDAVRVLLIANQLAQKVLDDDTVIIYPNVPAKQREYQELTVKAFYLANADVKQVLNSIRSVIKTRDIIFDERLNVLVMRDTPEAVRAAEKLVALQDQAEPEVVLQLEVLEVGTSRLQELGVRFPEQISYGIVGAAGTPGTVTLPEWLNRNSSLVRLTVSNPALIVNLRKLDSDTHLLANPHVRVRNREKAKVHIGERVPVITTIATANVGVAESVSYLDVGLKLELEPNIYLDDEVAIKVGLEVSNILDTITRASGTQVYRLGTRNASTTLRLKDGETQILAGLIQKNEFRATNKVPGLSELPIVGRLFSNQNDNNTTTEIVLLITPRIVRNIVRPQADIAEFASGTEGSMGAGGGGAQAPIAFPRPAPVQPPIQPPTPPAPPTAPAPGAPGGPPPTFPPPATTPSGGVVPFMPGTPAR